MTKHHPVAACRKLFLVRTHEGNEGRSLPEVSILKVELNRV